jgi:tRNA(Arg) A34 adenosine deaminase TadA
MMTRMESPTFTLTLPDWVRTEVDATRPLGTDAERMAFVVELSRQNVLRETGGPFAAAVFESETGRLVAVGLNLVTPLQSAVLHGEVVAIIMANRVLGSYTLRAPGMAKHELVTSCEPCAMCLGAVLWSGVRRLVTGATRDDAARLNFDEGPVFPESYAYLEARGIEVVREVGRAAAAAALDLYGRRGGAIYNG